MTLDPNQDRDQQISQMLDCCQDYVNQLSKWEKDFIVSIQDQFDSQGDLTQPQVDVLEKIYVKLP